MQMNNKDPLMTDEEAAKLLSDALLPESLDPLFPINNAKFYFECHITLEDKGMIDNTTDPPSVNLERFNELHKECYEFGFFLSKFANENKKEKELEVIATSRDTNFLMMVERMKEIMSYLKKKGFVVDRYKIEHAILDSNLEDTLKLF